MTIVHYPFLFRRGESTSRQVECLLDALNAFVRSSAEDCRGQVCRLGESLFPLFLQMWKKNPLVKVYVVKLNNMMIGKNTVFYVTSENTPVRKRMLKAVFLQLNRNRTSTSCWCNDECTFWCSKNTSFLSLSFFVAVFSKGNRISVEL